MPTKHIDEELWKKIEAKTVDVVIHTKRWLKILIYYKPSFKKEWSKLQWMILLTIYLQKAEIIDYEIILM